MTDKKISELTAITGANTALDDLFLIVDVSANQTKKITRQELNNATAINFYNTSTQTATDTATLTDSNCILYASACFSS
jgi:hypothetical protein